jgi:hypothetical protein
MFSTCVLCFGDYLLLAQRCLMGLFDASAVEPDTSFKAFVSDIRIGLHAVGESSRMFIGRWTERASKYVPVLWYEPKGNLLKYPTMRRMFFDTQTPIEKYIAWLDDDTYFMRSATEIFAEVARELDNGAYLVGQYRWYSPMSETYERFVKAQPWYKQAIPLYGRKFQFCIGGWWAGRRELATKYGYPQPELRHKGGDWILSLLCQSNGLLIKDCCRGIMVNADESGRPNINWRRGLSAGNVEKNLGIDYGQKEYSSEHQNFETVVSVWRDGRIENQYVLPRL